MKKIFFMGTALFLFVATGCSNSNDAASDNAQSVAAKKKTGIVIPVERAIKGAIQDQLTSTGIIEPNKQVTVLSKVTGKVIDMMVREGDRIGNGQAVARVNRDEVGAKFRDFLVESTIDGVVAKTHVDPGAPVGPGVPIATLVDDHRVKASARVIERDVGRLQLGQQALVWVEAYKDPFPGKLTFVSPTLDPMSHMAKIEIALDNQKRQLRVGMSSRMALVVAERENAVSVPKAALVVRDGQTTVFVIADDTVQVRQVTLGYSDFTRYEIVAGVSAGEWVAVGEQYLLQQGTIVSPREVSHETE